MNKIKFKISSFYIFLYRNQLLNIKQIRYGWTLFIGYYRWNCLSIKTQLVKSRFYKYVFTNI